MKCVEVRQIENYPKGSGDAPTKPIVIADCGVLSPDDPSLKDDPAATSNGNDVYEDYPADDERDVDNPEIALSVAKEVREIGNKLFKEGKIADALSKYQKSIRYLDHHPELPEDSPPTILEAFDALMAPLLLNSALAAIRIKPPTSDNAEVAVKYASRALDGFELDTSSKAKALYRRALAQVILKDDDNAESDLVQANQLVPDDKAIVAELAKVRQHKKEEREKAKKAFKKMFE